MGFELRNIKCTFVLNRLSRKLLSKFEKKKYNLILRLKQTIILTIYPSSSNRVHATGIRTMSNLQDIKTLFKACQTRIEDIVVDNSYWLKKPHIIDRFSEFASFCESIKKCEFTKIDLTSFALNADGYLNSIYLKHKNATGIAIIHRKCIALLGAKSSESVKLLTSKVENLVKEFGLFLKIQGTRPSKQIKGI